MYSQKNGITSSSSQNSSGQGASNSKSPFHTMSQYQPTKSQLNSETGGNVKFTGHFKDKIDEREKYLTAKYPNHQMVCFDFIISS